MEEYQRYQIRMKYTPDIVPHPCRFRVKINRCNLIRLIVKEFFTYRGKRKVIFDNPCVYGVFSGPIGGFLPKEDLCVGCLRCTTQYPKIAQIRKNSERSKLGDSFFSPDKYDTVNYEAKTGFIPVKGAGYRGPFGGPGWDGMWTDMSEIVRPTRDGIHGREFISTAVDIGGAPTHLRFDDLGLPLNAPKNLSASIPILFDIPPEKCMGKELLSSISNAARQLETYAVMPLEKMFEFSLFGQHLIPLITPSSDFQKLPQAPSMVELESFDKNICHEIRTAYPEAMIALRIKGDEDLPTFFKEGIRVFHLAANYHGKNKEGLFIQDFIREAHQAFVSLGVRDEVTLLGSGGIIAAEHVPKSIICGLDAGLLDTSLLAALQARFLGECQDQKTAAFQLPKRLSGDWAVQRIKNLVNSWRDQLLEVMGAMGLREVRRLRGEMGRAMFQKDFENEAFKGITGYEPK